MTTDTNELRRKINSVDIVDHVDIHANVKTVLAELLDRLEAAEKERDVLRDRLALESQENGALRDSVGRACEERDALRAEVIHWKEQKEPGAAGWRALARLLQAKVKEMEKQFPICRVKDIKRVHYMTKVVGLDPDALLYLSPGAQPAPSEQPEPVRKAWARFKNELHRSPDAPYPGMSEAFEQHFSQSFTDREWRAESATWAAAWKAAKRHGAQPTPIVPEGWKLVPTAESRHPGIYKMLSALHAVDNTPGASEWESYAAFLAAAPESRP